MPHSVSIVEYFSENSGSSCGYCKRKSSSFSHGLWGHILTPSDYQDMINRGWRRSGKYCYKPTMNKTCCPQYPIRCNVKEFDPRKSHKKVMKRFRNYIINDAGSTRKRCHSELPLLLDSLEKTSTYDSDNEESCESDDNDEEDINQQMQLDNQKAEEVEKNLKMNASENSNSNISSSALDAQPNDKFAIKNDNKTNSNSTPVQNEDVRDSKSKSNVKPGLGPDPNKPPARKAKDMRREKALLKKKLKAESGNAPSTSSSNPLNVQKGKSLLDQLTDLSSFPKDSKHKLEIRLLNAQTSDDLFMESFEESFQVYRKYQVAIHKDKPQKCTANQFTRFLCNSSLVRGGECNTRLNSSNGNSFFPDGFGAYHQQYLIDGKIVCVGVLDILPHCASSVYFYYDPEYSFLSLGTLSSLFEISYIRKLTDMWRPELFYYYMGFYIHSCPKMRYKSQYDPSYLLCPETYEWFSVTECNPKLDKSKYSRFNEDKNKKDVDSQPPTNSELNSVLVLHKHEAMPYGMLVELRRREVSDGGVLDRDEVCEYATLAGMSLAKKMLLYRS